jgi:L-iditol 2-dehydrogenase
MEDPRMAERTRAVVYHAPGDIRVEEIPIPPCGAGEIRVRVDACAVCGSDLKAWQSGNPRIRPPMVIGHEFTGIVETPGGDGDGFAVGDRIVMATSISCGACVYCRRGWVNLCVNLAPMGFSYPGGMAGFVTLPARALRNGHVVKVPPGLPARHAALAEPVSCAVNACEICAVAPGDTVVVVGAGPMGLINACVARAFGARKIILAEVNEARLRQGEAFGLDVRVNPATQDLAAVVRTETDGTGADVVIVAAPAAKAQEDALALARKRGTVCLFASLPEGKASIALNSRLIHYGELRVVGSSDSTPGHVRKALDLMRRGAIPLDKLATHCLGLEEVLKAFELMKSGEALRVVLIP